ncbi:MAG: PVC-type heme-binding CxxCH protein [Verrucomicrobiota bacterium]
MIHFRFVVLLLFLARLSAFPAADGNRLTYLDGSDPFYPHRNFPKLTTPQWVGEEGVEAVVILAIDDMRGTAPYESALRPLLERLKKIDGRAPASIMVNGIDTSLPQLQSWLKEGVTLEVHTLAHPCPLLARSNFVAAADTYFGCIDLMNHIPNNKAVAFRMPCCDSINSPSPRFYAEIFNRTTPAGQFLTIDSSVMCILTSKDTALPKELVTDPDGRERFRKYIPFPSFVTTIEDYPYPYVIGKLCWEFPGMVPSDWEAQNLHGKSNPKTVADWKAALDATVLKQGTFTFIFHPHGWIQPEQMVEFVDYAVQKHGRKVKFLNFREAQERLDQFLLAGQPIRSSQGSDHGVRLLDLNHDGFLDVVIGNENLRKTRVWNPTTRRWLDSDFPATLVREGNEAVKECFAILQSNGFPTLVRRKGPATARPQAWHFDGAAWVEAEDLFDGLEELAQPGGAQAADVGLRFRDVNKDGRTELILSNPNQNLIFQWSEANRRWTRLPFALPHGTSIVDAEGLDHGLRFADINEDGHEDVVFSNAERFSLHLFVPELYLGFQPGWSREVLSGKRGDAFDIPMIVRGGTHRNNGAWFHSKHLWVQNEDVAHLPNHVDRRSFAQLLGGLQPPPKTPQASLESMRVIPGFKIELVAHEPAVVDPVAFEWGADGKLWVVEMGDYPTGIDAKGKPGGRLRYLEDADGDGRFEKSTLFLDGLNFPTGVMPWRNGVLVSAAPEIFYAEDTNGDGKGDLKQVLFSGFNEGNQQHRVNGFAYGLDHWIYGANGDSGGEIRFHGWVTGSRTNRIAPRRFEPVNISGRDFRFRPDHGLFEAIEGQTQFGRHRDDWGHWFGNNNPTWLWHYFLPERYLARNPHLPVKTTRQVLANYPESTRVFAISQMLQRFNDIGMANHVTSGNSPVPYRDELFGAAFASSVFISEPVHNVVHREVLEPDGVTFRSHRGPGEETREFLASSDNWFRPILLKTGPDGALYIADMYRLVLEHPEWIPPDTQKTFDLRAGQDLGRIYRVYPEGASLRSAPVLNRLKTPELVAALDHANGWQRDTAQRLLIERGDKAAVPLLRKLARSSTSAKTRLQALCTLEGLEGLTAQELLAACKDPHAAVREHAVRLCEPFLRNRPPRTDKLAGAASERTTRKPRQEEALETDTAALEEQLLELTADPEIRVRYQLAFSLGEWSNARAGQALARLALNAADYEPLQLAVLSSAPRHLHTLITLLTKNHSPPVPTLARLFQLALASRDEVALLRFADALSKASGSQHAGWQFGTLATVAADIERHQSKVSSAAQKALDRLKELFPLALETALSETAPESDRLQAIRILSSTHLEIDVQRLAGLFDPRVPTSIQGAAIEALGRSQSSQVPTLLLATWKSATPELRASRLNTLLSRVEWAEALLAAVEAGSFSIKDLGPAQQQALLSHPQERIRQRARKIFGAASSNRRDVLTQFESALTLKGNARRGSGLFRQNCSTCHRFRNEGSNVGPDLAMISNKSPRALLESILDPNAAVESRYVSYNAVTKSGRDLMGIIASETANSLTLRNSGGGEEVVLRSELIELTSSGLSMMPEGFENNLSPQAMADLLAFLTDPATN